MWEMSDGRVRREKTAETRPRRSQEDLPSPQRNDIHVRRRASRSISGTEGDRLLVTFHGELMWVEREVSQVDQVKE